jgi:CHAT domain-containing protein/tetratricopeptide (TPR) repeat protein
VFPAVAFALVLCLAAPRGADRPADDRTLAADLLAQSDASARERWIEAHRGQLTAGLGREVAAQARVHYLANRYDPAYDAFSLAVRIGEIAGDPESRIRGLEGMGGVERFRGRAQEALPLLERAMREAEAAGDEAAVGRIVGAMGSARRRLGEYGAALELSERQLAVFERLGDAEWVGRAHNYIGIALGALGRCAEAIPHLEKSRDACEASDAAARHHDRSVCSPVYSNLGLCYQSMGNYAAALEAFGQCLQINEATETPDEPAAPLNNIGEVYRLQGAPVRAIDYYHRAYAVAAGTGEKEFMADALADEGGALLELGRTQEARRAFDRALAIGEEIHSPSVITGASAGVAEVLSRLGDRRGALQLLDQCLETAEHTEDRALEARTRRQIATLQLQEGQAAAALDLAGRAADTARRYELPEELWPALLVAGRADRALGHADAAEAALLEAVEVVEDLRAHAVGPDADRAVFLVPHAAPYQELVSLLADSGRSWDALAVAERSKGRVLLDVLAGGRMAIGSALSAADKVEERRLEGDVLTVNSELRDLQLRPSPDAARRTVLESRRNARRLALEDWRTRQYAAHPELRVLRGESRPLAPRDVGSLLADGPTVLLEYVLCDPHAYLFVLAAGSSSAPSHAVYRLELDSPLLVRLARDLRERLAGRNMEFTEPAARLYRALLSPARDALRGARRVVIVPDGALWDLPFQALQGPSGRFLIEDAAVSYVPSLSVLRDMQARRRAHGRAAGALLAIGNPEVSSQVREIARLYDPRASAVRVDAGARESWLKAEAPHYRILHVATHGTLDDASPLYSELVLAPPAAGERDDGLLEAREILELDLGADLAVLSACETGRGRAGAGEGLIGMTWAFFVAGCPTTVASQWKVEAASTDRLMLAFHRELRRSRAPAEALRLAALAQLRRGAERHPFYWAGFVAMGDAYSSAALSPR